MSELSSKRAAEFAPSVSRGWLDRVDIATGALPLVLWAAVGLLVFYALTIVYGIIDGYALPTTALFSAVPHGEIIERSEKYIPRLLLVIAIAGVLLDWAKAAGCELPRLARNESAAASIFLRWGLLILCLAWLLALSASGWSGRFEASGDQYSSIAGLFPHSDAADHYVGPMEQISTGYWSLFASRRPFGAGMRHLTEAAAGFSYVWTLVLQTVLIAAALFAAARSVIVWRGIWAGLAFCAFGYILTRPFIATTMSEALGLAWGLLSVMFLVDAMRLNSARHAFLGLIGLTFGEMTRMGSVFTIPALVLWIALVFGENFRMRARLFAMGCGAVVAVLSIQSLCAYLYGNPAETTGGNFSYVLCGLAVGGDWQACTKTFAHEFDRLTTEHAKEAFLYARAIQIIVHHPGGLIFGILRNLGYIFSGTLDFMLKGYGGAVSALPTYSLLFLIPGLIFTLRCKPARGERWFWFLMLTSIIVSAALIFRDDGYRTMSVTWPLVALLLCSGCTSSATSTLGANFEPLMGVRRGSLLIATVVVAVIAAPAATRLWPGRDVQSLSNAVATAKNSDIVLFGRTLTGFLVLPDDVPLPRQTPAIHASIFAELIDHVGMERDYGSFLNVAMKKVPFAFVTGPRIGRGLNQTEQVYLAPIGILTRGPAKAWRMALDDTLHNKWIHNVVRVEPVR